jgi:uncharacterized protein (TIGR00251 family)
VSIEIAVRVIPRARKTAVAGFRDEALVIRLAAPPVDGAANEALIRFLASTLQIPRRAIQIRSGEHARNKRLSIDGVTLEQIRALQ